VIFISNTFPHNDYVTVEGGWRRLHNEELHKLYASPDIISDQF